MEAGNAVVRIIALISVEPGEKDLVPSRIELSYDDEKVEIIPF